MDKAKGFFSNKAKWLRFAEYGAYALLVIFAAVFATKESWREGIRASLFPEYRKVLSTVTGELFNDGVLYKVIKVQTRDKMSVEVYGQSQTGSRPLFDRFTLHDPKDAHFHIYKDVEQQATNLALKDVDNDDILEILAPSSGKDAVVHLNVYRFDTNDGKFELVTNE